MIPRTWRWGAIFTLGATATAILTSRLGFGPVPWADGSAFYLPGLPLAQWPPIWHMHNQAAFIPSYDQANFNIMPLLSFLLGVLGRSGLLQWIDAQRLLRAFSVLALLAWAALLWKWAIDELTPRLDPTRARFAATSLALAALWDPILRWGTLVVRTEMWVGLCWLWLLRELHRWEATERAFPIGTVTHTRAWSRAAWRISAAIAVSAYFHYEAVYFVPAIIVGLGFAPGWLKRLVGIGWRTSACLSPWLLYMLTHFELFAEQMQIQFFRLAHANLWMANPYMIFHSLFIEHGSPATSPKFFNVGKGIFWIGVLLLSALSARTALKGKSPSARAVTPRRSLLASAVAFASCFYLWASKAEVWFVTLCHVAFWPWIATALFAACDHVRLRAFRALVAATAAFALLSLGAGIGQALAISPEYNWPTYYGWIDCIERALGPLDARTDLKIWQPHVPDILVELSSRHPGWDLTRHLDFPNREKMALAAGQSMDAIIYTRHFNPSAETPRTDYLGALRETDRIKMLQSDDLPFGKWALDELLAAYPDRWRAQVCETGPFWSVILTRTNHAL